MPSIGVLVIAYARPDLLQVALESVAGQRRKPDEVIVLDDCSPEPLREKLRPIPGLDVRFIRHERNQGPGAGARTLLNASSADLVTLLNDDDVWYPEFLAECESALVSAPAAVVAFCDHDVINADGGSNRSESRVFSVRYGRAGMAPGPCDALPLLAAVTQTIAVSFALYRRCALQAEVVVAGTTMWDYFAGLSAAGTGAGAVFVAKSLGAYRLSPGGISSSWDMSRRAQADYALSRLRGVCWLIRQRGSRRWRRRLALEAGLLCARAIKTAARARHPPTAAQAVLALLGVNLLRPAPWPRP